ncbi:uncharacterized protein ASCRUDRAFT_68021 [Ascoidea rubescens DSM 1968]|uniref:Uncharacterized protein n=1 Tax=Ascoidea rubescens DSM 1968 TaxID=1344418 RepID=A0A1D2VQT7_9ASCO|nr:hypothetical protein ASCRUDRAFT_68021 [Ascoidea rubescens DSM 1968]ODV63971.1 hypothetical protein ASCRUDRAFT_68021 [Ascoidea rubescens DSM 1968]
MTDDEIALKSKNIILEKSKAIKAIVKMKEKNESTIVSFIMLEQSKKRISSIIYKDNNRNKNAKTKSKANTNNNNESNNDNSNSDDNLNCSADSSDELAAPTTVYESIQRSKQNASAKINSTTTLSSSYRYNRTINCLREILPDFSSSKITSADIINQLHIYESCS